MNYERKKSMSKSLKIAIGITLIIGILFIGTFIGGKIAEENINSLVDQGAIFATTESLNKYIQENQNFNKEVEASNDQWPQSGEGSVEEYRNEIAGIEQIAHEIINPLIKEKVSNIQLYQKVNNKGGR